MCFLLQPEWEGLFHNTSLASISYPRSQTTKQLITEETNKKQQAQHISFETVIISAIHCNHISIFLTVTWWRTQVILIGCIMVGCQSNMVVIISGCYKDIYVRTFFPLTNSYTLEFFEIYRTLELLPCEALLYLPKFTNLSCIEYCCHVWLVPPAATWIC